ncbi:hypothetical protein EDB83DRAFT_2322105 [Lactarius deliciosus]|nr:hypothetical protein EDB83DRAFT_2322105 [Lactarius deliciosus]
MACNSTRRANSATMQAANDNKGGHWQPQQYGDDNNAAMTAIMTERHAYPQRSHAPTTATQAHEQHSSVTTTTRQQPRQEKAMELAHSRDQPRGLNPIYHGQLDGQDRIFEQAQKAQ